MVRKYKIIKICTDFIIDDNKTIELYLFIFKFLKSIFGIITINEVIIATKKVIKLALSLAIKINHKIIGKT